MKSVRTAELIDYLRDKGLKCTFAESLTGGMAASGIVDIPGASDVLEGSIVAYSDAYKINVLGVPSEIIASKTAVSSECAVSMAEQALKLSGVDVAVSVTGYAGPGDGPDGTPSGTVYIGYADKNGSGAIHERFAGSRDAVRQCTRDYAYDLMYERAAAL